MAKSTRINGFFGRELQAILFDMDGVLIDSERLHMLADAETFVRHGLSVPEGAWAEIFGMKSEDGLRMMLERYGAGAEDLALFAREKRERYLELAKSELALVPNVRDFVTACRDRSLKTAVVTSGKSRHQIPILERFDMLDLFDTIVTGDEVVNGKPDPEPYLLAASRLGVDSRVCLVVEDANSGIRSAKAAGCLAVGITTILSKETLVSAGADLVVDGFHELMEGSGFSLLS
jgi:beta-phosphoglucomutase